MNVTAIHHRQRNIQITRYRRQLVPVALGDMSCDLFAASEGGVVERRHDVRIHAARYIFKDPRFEYVNARKHQRRGRRCLGIPDLSLRWQLRIVAESCYKSIFSIYDGEPLSTSVRFEDHRRDG